jgi:hypothetical protein
VKAVTAVGIGPKSNEISLTAIAPPPCVNPTGPFFDDVEPSANPGWQVDTAENELGPVSPPWQVVTDSGAKSPTHSFSSDASTLALKDDRLIAPPQNISATTKLTFWHRYGFEDGYDGGVLEVSNDFGATWVDVQARGSFISGGYNGSIDPGLGSPIAGRDAWTGGDASGSMTKVEVNLGGFAGINVMVRFRLVTDPLAPLSTPGVAWYIDDVEFTNLQHCPGATPSPTPSASPTTTPSGTPTASPSATATATASPTATATASPTATATPTATASPSPAQLLNISTRARVQTGDNIVIAGFIITGRPSKRVLLKARGPSLPVPDQLEDPTLELRAQDGSLLVSNDNWKDAPNKDEIEATGNAPTDDRESAILMTLAPGTYTAILRGKNDSTGVALVEVYDRQPAPNSVFANISTRGFVEAGDNVMIGGFIVGGEPADTEVLVRAIGPSLKSQLPAALDDPTLELHDSNGATIATNDNWKDDQQSEIEATTIPPSNDLESALVRDLGHGGWTAIVRGKDNTVGIALVEVYNIR